MMNWYAVKVLYCVRINGEPMENKLDAHYHEDEFYEEKLMLVQAEDAKRPPTGLPSAAAGMTTPM